MDGMEAAPDGAPGAGLEAANGVIVYKMTGSGNDFVFVDGRATPLQFWTAHRIRAVCARQNGVGADGLVVLEPGSNVGAVRLHYFNRDGLRAELCGNASLCAARLATWIELAPVERLVLETDAGPVPGRSLPGTGELAEIGLGEVSGMRPADVELTRGETAAHYVRIGVPHLVVQVRDLEAVDVVARGRALRLHPAFEPDGANVNFVSCGTSGWAMRTYERGVEDETLACGTGSVAVASILAETGRQSLPLDLRTASGCILRVGGGRRGPGHFENMKLIGEGRLVFRAILGG